MSLRIALAQTNITVGDVWENAERIIRLIKRAGDLEADLVAFPEQALSGYPTEDLLLKPQFLQANYMALEKIAANTQGICAVVGFPGVFDDVYNCAAVCYNGKIEGVYKKMHLPNYAVFDEMRYFMAGDRPMVIDLGGCRVGLSVCEDIWLPGSPVTDEVLSGDAHCILNISASPFSTGKPARRARMLATRASDLSAYMCFVNMVGGQDELVFDGNSLIADYNGEFVAHAKPFNEDLLITDLDIEAVRRLRLHDPRFRIEKKQARKNSDPVDVVTLSDFPKCVGRESNGKKVLALMIEPRLEPDVEGLEEIYLALKIGTRDYIHKNGFEKVVLGSSGGVDSALTATIAMDALGEQNVVSVFMPSRFTSNESREDAEQLAKNLGIEMLTVPIEETFEAYKKMLAPSFTGRDEDTTEENLQARIRGNILMALSNKFGYLVLTTGNKSENSVGYATLYGDMAGGFSILKDVSKQLVYQLCRYRNKMGENPVIPKRILTKEPTAELRENQKDSDSLPPYALLDPILELYVEKDFSYDQIVQAGYDSEIVRKVIRLVDINEYKRRQSCPGIKISQRAFGKDRRLPITNKYCDGEE